MGFTRLLLINPWYQIKVPLTVSSKLSAIGWGSSRSCAAVIRDALDKLCISDIRLLSLATDDSWLITTNPITESIESMVMTTMSSVRVKPPLSQKLLFFQEHLSSQDSLSSQEFFFSQKTLLRSWNDDRYHIILKIDYSEYSNILSSERQKISQIKWYFGWTDMLF